VEGGRSVGDGGSVRVGGREGRDRERERRMMMLMMLMMWRKRRRWIRR
jgi:hypothetical protein